MIENPLEYKNKLLSELREGKLTMAEFQKECAYWYLNTFETFSPKPDPSTPTEYMDYKQMPFEKRIKVSSEFFKSEPIKSYLEFRDKVRAENFSHKESLKEFMVHIPKEDVESREKYRVKFYDFQTGNYD